MLVKNGIGYYDTILNVRLWTFTYGVDKRDHKICFDRNLPRLIRGGKQPDRPSKTMAPTV